MVFIDCNQRTKYKPLRVMFKNYWISMDQEHYIWDVQNDGQYCLMLIMPNSYDFGLLGQPIYQGYYTHHDMEARYMAFGPLRIDGAPPLKYDPIIPPTQLPMS